MDFDINRAVPVSDEMEQQPAVFDISRAVPVDQPQQQQPAVGGADAVDRIAEFAQAFNVGIPQLLDMPSHLVNWMLEKAGVDARLPATMEKNFNKLPGGEGGFMPPGLERDAIRGGANLTQAAMGMMPVARTAGTMGSAALDALGAGSTMAAAPVRAVAPAVAEVRDNLPSINPREMARREAAQMPLLRKTGDATAAGYRLNNANRAIPDKSQAAAMKQGFENALVAMTAASTPRGKAKMGKMIDNVEAGRENMLNRNTRPVNVVGESILDRLNVVIESNKIAGGRIKPIVESLKGEIIDPSPAVNKMLESLAEMGVSFDPAKKSLSFSGSTIDELPGPTNAIKRLLNRMLNVNNGRPGGVDAYQAHNLKRYIDEVVTYGKGAEGLAGDTERMLKTLRRDINQIIGDKYPGYRKVNTQYHETIQAIDNLQSVAGKKVDLRAGNADRQLGLLANRITSNAVSSAAVENAINHVDSVAKKYLTGDGTDIVPFKMVADRTGLSVDDLDDSILSQYHFSNELDKFFGSFADNSLKGNLETAERVVNSAQGGIGTMAAEALKSGVNKARGINDDKAIKALRRLLKE